MAFPQTIHFKCPLILILYISKQKEGNYDIVTGTRYAQNGGVSLNKMI